MWFTFAFTITVYFIFETPRYRKEIRRRKWNRKVFVLLFPNPFVNAYCKTCALLHLFFRVVMLLIYGCMVSLQPILFNKICKKAYLYFAAETVSGPLVMYLSPTMYIYFMYRITILWILCNCTTEIYRGGCSISSVWYVILAVGSILLWHLIC